MDKMYQHPQGVVNGHPLEGPGIFFALIYNISQEKSERHARCDTTLHVLPVRLLTSYDDLTRPLTGCCKAAPVLPRLALSIRLHGSNVTRHQLSSEHWHLEHRPWQIRQILKHRNIFAAANLFA